MDRAEKTFVALLAITFAIAFLVLNRNDRVFEARGRVARAIYSQQVEDITKGRTPSVGYEALDKISYDEMFLKFWVPVGVWEDRLREETGLEK